MKRMADIFVAIADDCETRAGRVPPHTSDKPGLARLQYDLLIAHPYEYDHHSFNFEIYCQKNGIAEPDRNRHRDAFFSRGHPCLRASPLTRTYGFGAHYNSNGKIALYPADSIAYAKFLRDPGVAKEKAMRNHRVGLPEAEDSDQDRRHALTQAVGHR